MLRQASLLLCLLLAVLQPASSFFRLPSPWAWRCIDGVCVKEHDDGVADNMGLNKCKLTCGPHGALWPKPSEVKLSKDVAHFLPSRVFRNSPSWTCKGEACVLLDKAFELFKRNINTSHPDCHTTEDPFEGPWDPSVSNYQLRVDITLESEDDYLTYNTNESYSLAVNSDPHRGVTLAVIIAPNFFGARHALETLSQLIDYDENKDALQIVSSAAIHDHPAFKYRGILLDTSRNFIDIETIKRTIDGMAANKLNTFHWHITDSHSFPLYMESLPKMAYYGAYSSRQVYYPADVREIVQYGRVRGVRILPEFDAPAHVGNGFQWGEKEGLGKLAVCVNREPWQSFCVEPPCGQLNLANENMYKILGTIYEEFAKLFAPMDLFHYGGDEVNLNCWNTTAEITSWMESNGFGLTEDAYYKQWSVFQNRSEELLTKANRGNPIPGIIWTSHLTEKGRVGQYLNNKRYIIQIWTTGSDPLIAELLKEGYDVIFSNYDAWYLDCGFGAWVGDGNNWCSPYKGWQTVYDNSPTNITTTLAGAQHLNQIFGGEAALWTEQADSESVDGRLWPRGAALAERLWSNPTHKWDEAELRLIHQRQRLVKRGIQADRIQPQWCHHNEGLCYLKKNNN